MVIPLLDNQLMKTFNLKTLSPLNQRFSLHPRHSGHSMEDSPASLQPSNTQKHAGSIQWGPPQGSKTTESASMHMHTIVRLNLSNMSELQYSSVC